VTGEIEMELLEGIKRECAIWKALAVGMDISKIVLSLKQGQQLID